MIKHYICSDCGHEFDEPEYCTVREPHTELDGCPYEELTYAVCPECGSEEIEEGEADE